jgi:hypothetical protein
VSDHTWLTPLTTHSPKEEEHIGASILMLKDFNTST